MTTETTDGPGGRARNGVGSAKPATISRVADAAGVSRATVSRVMNGSPTVAPHLADRVRSAAAALNYQPSIVARSLAVGRTSTIAFVVPDLANPMFQDVLRSLSHAAARQGHRLLVADSEENVAEEQLIAAEAARRCDGLVLCAPRMPDERLIELAPQLRPFVLMNRDVPGLDVPSVTVDYAAGIRDLVAHLMGLGHRRVTYLSGPPTSSSNRLRLRALREFAPNRLQVVERQCGATFSDGHAVAGEVVEDGTTAVIAYNDLVAFGALSGLHELGVDVPRQISVTGFDDIPFARYTTPPITTAAVPPSDLGQHAWRRLWSLLSGTSPEPDVRFRPRLVVRGSTAPAAG